jgi:hypothetical protein
MGRLTRLAIACAAIGAWGCAAQGTDDPRADVSGVWEGGFAVGNRANGAYEMTLRQQGERVTGVLRLPYRAQEWAIQGTVSGNEFSFQPADSSHRLIGHFVVKGDSMTGDTLFGNNYPARVQVNRRR